MIIYIVHTVFKGWSNVTANDFLGKLPGMLLYDTIKSVC